MDSVDFLRKRVAAQLSQAEVARRTGYSRTHVIAVEAGQRRVSAEYASSFLAALQSGGNGGSVGGPVKYPVLLAKEKARTAIAHIDTAIQDLERRDHTLNRVRSAVGKLTIQLNLLLDNTSGTDSSESSTEISSADDYNYNRVAQFIRDVTLEMMTDHRLHFLSDERVEQFFGWLTKELTVGVRRARNLDELGKLKEVDS
jgi:transcriptional regulator with XRE-family HTH domain